MQNIKEEYSNRDITIVWKPKICNRSTLCWKSPVGLPEVFDPKKKPWINTENSTTEIIIEHIKKCPTGALSYYMNIEPEANKITNEVSIVEIIENGPLKVYGNIEVRDALGNSVQKNATTYFCRCGSSSNKPYCDGAHIYINFKG